MGIRLGGMLLAVVTTAFVIAPGSSALAQFNMPGLGGGGATSSDRMGGGGGAGKGKGGGRNRFSNEDYSEAVRQPREPRW